jgi:hypothetical protein
MNCAIPRRMHRRTLLRLVAVLGVVATASCLSPTLPLPPPDQPDVIEQSATIPGNWEISGTCLVGGLITVFNERTGHGVVVEDRNNTGRYRVELQADLCDLAWVSQELNQEISARTTFVIQERTTAGLADAGDCK